MAGHGSIQHARCGLSQWPPSQHEGRLPAAGLGRQKKLSSQIEVPQGRIYDRKEALTQGTLCAGCVEPKMLAGWIAQASHGYSRPQNA